MGWMYLLVLIAISQCHASKKKDSNINPREFLEKEGNQLIKEGFKCSLKKVTRKSVENLRLYVMDDATASCIIKNLQEHSEDGFLWTVLGKYFDSKKPQSSQANACFKQATKHSGKHTAHIQDWYFIGPFVIGKMELDGDPLEAFGGIRNASRYRLTKGSKYYSELVLGGEVHWIHYSQTSHDQVMKVNPKVNWNDLVSSLGSMGITEWQGWIVADFAVNEDNLNLIVQCLGVSTIYIDGKPYTGDLYHRENIQFGVNIGRGVHSLHVRLRTKVAVNLKCSLSLAPKSFEALTQAFIPDLYDGNVFGRYISVPISNYHPTKWLKNFRVTVTDQSDGDMLVIKTVVKSELSIAPGQIRPLRLKIVNESPQILTSCHDIDLELTLTTSEGQTKVPLKLRCRERGESFLYTFLDHDGSVQLGAAVQPIRSCPGKLCPVVLSLHGTTVPPQNQADSYKKMVGKNYEFGVEHAWLVAPTRHGAHNWEGPGALTALSAMFAVVDLVKQSDWLEEKVDPDHVIYAGHSMGGHGSWHLATHYPDRALALVSLAGWIKKEEYGDSNLFFKHDMSTSHTDPAVKSIMEGCIAENDADRHVSNLQGVPVLARIGANDRTVHPYFVRRMYRLLSEIRVLINYTEIADKEHWWWDTWKTNDGGVVNDPQLRDFKSKYIEAHLGTKGSCGDEDASCGADGQSKYTQDKKDHFKLTVVNPALGDGLRGVRILQQIVPFRTSTVEGRVEGEQIHLITTNVRRFRITETKLRRIHWSEKTVMADGNFKIDKDMLAKMRSNTECHICRSKGSWEFCKESLYSVGERGPLNLGPARRVAENNFIIIVGTLGSADMTKTLLTMAVYIANQFYLTSDAVASIVRDSDVSVDMTQNKNIILIGGPESNQLTSGVLSGVPISVKDKTIRLEDCTFSHLRTGVLTLAPNGPQHLALILMGMSVDGLMDIAALATPTIPPMARSPFSNMIPDYVVTGPDFGWKGPGGYVCAGFYGNKWEYRTDTSSCVCQY